MKELKYYRCEYCNKYKSQQKKRTLAHEANCFFNPDTKSCAKCVCLIWLDQFESFEVEQKQACLKNIDISASMTTQCPEFVHPDNFPEETVFDPRTLFPAFDEDLARERWERVKGCEAQNRRKLEKLKADLKEFQESLKGMETASF